MQTVSTSTRTRKHHLLPYKAQQCVFSSSWDPMRVQYWIFVSTLAGLIASLRHYKGLVNQSCCIIGTFLTYLWKKILCLHHSLCSFCPGLWTEMVPRIKIFFFLLTVSAFVGGEKQRLLWLHLLSVYTISNNYAGAICINSSAKWRQVYGNESVQPSIHESIHPR